MKNAVMVHCVVSGQILFNHSHNCQAVQWQPQNKLLVPSQSSLIIFAETISWFHGTTPPRLGAMITLENKSQNDIVTYKLIYDSVDAPKGTAQLQRKCWQSSQFRGSCGQGEGMNLQNYGYN